MTSSGWSVVEAFAGNAAAHLPSCTCKCMLSYKNRDHVDVFTIYSYIQCVQTCAKFQVLIHMKWAKLKNAPPIFGGQYQPLLAKWFIGYSTLFTTIGIHWVCNWLRQPRTIPGYSSEALMSAPSSRLRPPLLGPFVVNPFKLL